MLKDKWLETHCTYNYNNYHSFGELIKKDNNEYSYSTVVIGNYDSLEYSFIENYKDNIKNGIVFERKLVEGANFSQFSAAFFKNNNVEGPYLVFRPNGYNDDSDDYDIHFSNFINKKIEGPVVEIYPKEQLFTIEKWNNNQYENRRIRFENGYLILEELVSDNKYRICHQIKCGWNYQPSRLFSHKLPSFVPNFGKSGFKPAIVKKIWKNKKYEYHFSGMIETYLLDQAYHIDENKNMIFTNDVAQIGIIDFENGNKYFGCISSVGKNGEYKRNGCGCFVSGKERFFGNYSLSNRYGTGMSINKDTSSLGCYYFNEKTGVFFERNQGSLTLCWYDKDKKQDYYVIDNKTFDVKQYDKNGKFIKNYSFNEPSKEKVELTKEDKINPKNLETLKQLKLKYTIDSDGGIIVNGINESPNKLLNIFIPGFVKGIAAHSFENYTKLTHVEIENGVLFLGEKAFFGCTNIKTIKLSNKITEINAYTFSSKKLNKVVIPNSVSLVKNYSFIKCPNIEYVEFKNSSCVVENHAFAEKAKHYNGRNLEKEQENRELFEKKYEKIDKENRKSEDKDLKKEKKKEVIKFKKSQRKEKKDKLKDNISSFFDSIGSFFGMVFETIGDFFGRMFGAIGGFFASVFGAIGSFFVKVWDAICNGVSFLFNHTKDFVLSSKGFLILGVVIMVLYLLGGIFGLTKWLSWNAAWHLNVPFLGYHWFFTLCGVSLVKTGNAILAILGIVVTVLGAIVDLVIYILIIVLAIILFTILQILIQFLLIFIIPVGICVLSIMLTIKSDDNKIPSIVLSGINIVLLILYFVFLFPQMFPAR